MPNLSKKEWIAVVAAVVFIVYTMFGQSLEDSFKQATGSNTNMGASIINNTKEDSSMNGVKVQDVVVGTGATIEVGMIIDVHYVLKLADGTVIQDSKLVNGNMPFSFQYGVDSLIAGWNMGIQGMKVGGKRIITIPPELGYGERGNGPVPPNATIVFEIEVVSASASQ